MQITAPTQAAEVHYTVEVLDADGRVARRLPRKRNLILDQGLNYIAEESWAAAFPRAAVGTGTTPTKRDSGAITFSRTGSTVTASAGFFEAADVGRLLKFDSGEEVRITAFTNATTVTTADSGTIAAAEGTIWYVNQTGLAAESKRTGTYSTDSGANGSTFLGGVWTHKRTFLFPAESGTVVYREIGWSSFSGAGNNLFGRDLLPGVGVTLVAGQQLRVTVELSVAYVPAASAPYASVVAGWSQPGACGIEFSDIETVSASGGVTPIGGGLDPHALKRCYLTTEAAAISPMADTQGTTISSGIGVVDCGSAGYVSGSFSRTYSATFSAIQANSTSIRSILFGRRGVNANELRRAFRVVLDAPETKTSSQSLTLTFRLSWGRVLNNA